MAFCICVRDMIHDRIRPERNRIRTMILLYVKIDANIIITPIHARPSESKSVMCISRPFHAHAP